MGDYPPPFALSEAEGHGAKILPPPFTPSEVEGSGAGRKHASTSLGTSGALA